MAEILTDIIECRSIKAAYDYANANGLIPIRGSRRFLALSQAHIDLLVAAGATPKIIRASWKTGDTRSASVSVVNGKIEVDPTYGPQG